MKKRLLSLLVILSMLSAFISMPTVSFAYTTGTATASDLIEVTKLEKTAQSMDGTATYTVTFNLDESARTGNYSNYFTFQVLSQRFVDEEVGDIDSDMGQIDTSAGSGSYDATGAGDAYEKTVSKLTFIDKVSGQETYTFTFTMDESAYSDSANGIDGSVFYIFFRCEGSTVQAYQEFNISNTGDVLADQAYITLDANGGNTITDPPASIDAGTYTAANLTAAIGITPKRTGYKFLGWAENSADTAPTASVTLSKNEETSPTTLYAVWQEKPGLTAANFKTPLTSKTYTGSDLKPDIDKTDATTGTIDTITIKYDGEESTNGKTAVGTYAITIDVAESDDYAAATNLDLGNWSITKASKDITIADKTVTYGEDATVTPTAVDGLTSDDYEVQYSVQGQNSFSTTVPASAGTYDVKVVLTTSGAEKYTLTTTPTATLTINKKELEITYPSDITKSYDTDDVVKINGSAMTINDLTLTGKVNNDDVSLIVDGTFSAEYDNANAGADKPITISGVKLDGTAKDNYEIKNGELTKATGAITALEIEATLKADSTKSSKVYGNEMSLAIEDFTFNTSATNLETELAGLAFTSDALTAAANVGEYGITVTQPTSGNYNVTTDSKITVTACPTIIVVTPATGLKYNNAEYSDADLFTAKVYANPDNASDTDGLTEIDVTSVTAAYTKDGSAVTAVKDAGEYTASVSAQLTSNYAAPTAAAETITIAKADLSSVAVTTDPSDMTYLPGEEFSAAGAVVTATYNAGTNYEYTADVTASAAVTSPANAVSGQKLALTDSGSNVTFGYTETGNDNVNAAADAKTADTTGTLTVAKADNAQKPAVTPVNAATVGGNGQLVIKKADDDTVTSDTAVVEYKPVADTDWTQATLTDGTVTVEVPSGTYEVRYAETDTAKAGASVQAVVSDAAENTNTPDVTATAPTTLDGKGTLTIAKKADDTVTSDTAPVQYRVKGTEDWTDTVLADGTVTVDAAPGTYEVRYGATEDFAPGTIVEADVPAVVTYKITATPTDENSHGTYTYTVGDGEPATADTANVIPGTLVKVTATPDSSYKVSKITLTDPDGKTTTVSTTKSEFTMPANDVTITVTFAKKSSGGGGGVSSYTVKYDVGENGKITSGKASESVVSSAKPKNVPEVTANDGYKFVGWTQDGETIVDPTTVSVTKAITFTAVYEEAGEATPTPTPTAKPQGDTDNHEHYINGYEDGTFRAEDTITRAEVATIFALALSDYDETQTYASEYSDLDTNEWYANYVSYLSGIGAITGYEDGTFRAQQSITRQEFATMIARLGEVLEAGDMPFADVSEENWGVDYIYTTYANGWVSGYEDGTFRPENPITRAEAVKIVNGYLGRGTDEAGLADADYTVFPDVETSHWAYFDIIEAANDHTFTKDTMPEIWVD